MKFEKRKQCLSEIYVPLCVGLRLGHSQSHRTDEVLVEAHWDFSHKGDGRNAQTPKLQYYIVRVHNMSEPITKHLEIKT